MIYLIHPAFTLPDSPQAELFSTALDAELQLHTQTSLIKSPGQLQTVEPGADDAVVFFNHKSDAAYQADLVRVLGSTTRIFPVAVSKEFRTPPPPATEDQSFDVHHELQLRGLDESNTATVASVLARRILASLQPTLSQLKMRFFLSHRRADGEDLATWFYQELRKIAEDPFQDLSDIFVGENAQPIIESRLAQSDAVIFLDTPLACDSKWVAKELEIALSLNLPIVWVSAGGEDNRKKLKVKPAATPHFKIDVNTRNREIVDNILKKAFALARESGMRIFDTIRRLKGLAGRNVLKLVEQDKNKLIYSLSITRTSKDFRYPESPMKHLVQFYGRWPKEEDRTSFLTQLQAQPEIPELGLLLGPIPQQKITVPIDGKSPMAFVDSGEEYVSTLERYITQTALPSNPPAERSAVLEKKFGAPLSAPGMHSAPKPIAFRPRRKGLIISGAFPDNVTAQAQQDLIDAVHAFTHAVFDRGGIVIFGAHPFFVPLIFDMARRKREKDFREAVHLYFSTFFRDLPQEYKDNATTFSIPPVNNDRNASLRAMREAMMADPQAAGLVAVGGRHPRPDIKPGVDEEIGLAKETDLPIFLIGSVQGRSCALAAELNANKWKDRKNPLSVEENEQLRTSLDFSSLAAMVLNSLGI